MAGCFIPRKIYHQRGLLSWSLAIRSTTCLKKIQLGASFSTAPKLEQRKAAVILSGCGVFDGSEVHEAAACLAALSRHGIHSLICAPDVKQAHVVDHWSGQEMEPSRSVVVEAARIARGPVTPLSELKGSDTAIEALVIPGGFGAAKNLSDFAFKGTDMRVNDEVERVIHEFHQAGKPIAMCCIAPILAARVFGPKNVELTLGQSGDESLWPYGAAIEAAKSMGANVRNCEVHEVVIDLQHKLVTSPAFMYNGEFHEIQDGVSNMIAALVKLMEKS